MEDELNYSTVVFRNDGPSPKKTKEEETVYAEVKNKGNAADKSSTAPTDGEAASHIRHFRLLAACLGIICALLAAAVVIIIYFSMVMSEQKANLHNLTTQNLEMRMEGEISLRRIEELNGEKEELNGEKEELNREKEELNREKDSLNWTLGVVFEFDNFPVNRYCPQKGHCKPCQDGWRLFQQSCYYFYNKGYGWKTWTDSRWYCQQTQADLVVIGSLEEQEFINNNTNYYYDIYHGFWIGLSKTADKWLWIDGSNQTLGYWMREGPGNCALSIPGRDPMVSWNDASCNMRNKFICESKALFKSD